MFWNETLINDTLIRLYMWAQCKPCLWGLRWVQSLSQKDAFRHVSQQQTRGHLTDKCPPDCKLLWLSSHVASDLLRGWCPEDQEQRRGEEKSHKTILDLKNYIVSLKILAVKVCYPCFHIICLWLHFGTIVGEASYQYKVFISIQQCNLCRHNGSSYPD